MATEKLKILLAGAGFMGVEHVAAAENSRMARYDGIFDVNSEAARELAAKYSIAYFSDLNTAVERLMPDAVDICVPTSCHLEIIRLCSEKGIHVLCEKPLSLTLDQAFEIRKLTEEKGLRLMVAQVLRFWPEYVYTVEAARNGEHGRILAVDCKRLSAPPAWNSWMVAPDVGGGAVIDLQIHDVDFIYQLLGRPESVFSSGRVCHNAVNYIHNKWRYGSNVAVVNEASYLMPPSYPFRMYFKVEFAEAVFEMDSWREKGSRLMVYPRRGGHYVPKLRTCNAYAEEIGYFAECVTAGRKFEKIPLDDAIQVLDLCHCSREACLNLKEFEVARSA